MILSLAVFAAVVSAAAPEWENLEVNSIGRLPARTYSMPLADESAALTDALEFETPYVQSLNGDWKISWAGDPALRLRGFEAKDYDDSDWLTIDVPSCVEMRGFGSPGYTNVRYPHALAWPKILDRGTMETNYNPVSSYRTRFTVPPAWKSRRVILRFDGVYSAYYVWVNGKFIGYAEDSKLPSEFDITEAVDRQGENVLAVEVYRWCDGSYLEDQDMFRFSGIFRDVTLWALPEGGIWDFAVKYELLDGLKRAKLHLEGVEYDVARVYDANGDVVGRLAPDAPFMELDAPRLWSAEDPCLYTLVVIRGKDIRARRFGFKEQRIDGQRLLINGRAVRLKGVNRHETSPENGRTVSLAEMRRDIELMKRYNIDTVRTSHYPDHRLWYDLCDRYGLYVIAEANVEGHEPGYGEDSLGARPEFFASIVERNERHVVTYRNHPSIIIWSAGNETGHGDGFRQALAVVKRLDPTRPTHWERGNADADIDSVMYPDIEWLERRGKLGASAGGKMTSQAGGEGFSVTDQFPGKPHIMCEYAHAMGNAIGNLEEYWRVIYRYPCLAGGCIWDWVDQAVWKYTDEVDPATGKRRRFLAYGGDFDEQPNDGPFCCNGIIGAKREVSAKLIEVGHVYRNLVVTKGEDGAFVLENRFGFTGSERFQLTWTLKRDGVVRYTGQEPAPAVAPLTRAEFRIGELESLLEALAGCGDEITVEFEFSCPEATAWAPRGWILARNELKIEGDWYARERPESDADPTKVHFTSTPTTLEVAALGNLAVFDRASGTLSRLVMNGKTILADPAAGVTAGPRLTVLRAFTDNDAWMRRGDTWSDNPARSCYSRGLTQLRYHARPLVATGATVRVVTEVTGSKSAGYVHYADWNFLADGSIRVDNRVVPHGAMPPGVPRLGLSLVLDPSLENLVWYGRGPYENYIDRRSASFLGVYSSTVTAQYEEYVRPQDNGYKTDVRWLELTDGDGAGVRFTASEELFVQALHCQREDLEFARHRNGELRTCRPVPRRNEVYLNLDVRQTGLGGGSCGPWTMAKYCFDPNETVVWSLTIEGVK